MKDKKRLKKIEGILTEDETIEKSFDLEGCQVYATDKRLLMLEGRTIRDFDYTHISSVAYSSKRYWWLILVGIANAAILMFLADTFGFGDVGMVVGAIVGLIFIITGILAKSEWVEANVVGIPKPIKYKGERQDLDSLLKIIRQKRATEHTASQKETKDSDFIDTIRKLAELRDKGILTQEEFEEKKSKILRDSD